MRFIAPLSLSALLCACAWVKTTPEGQTVRVVNKRDVQTCDFKGEVTVSLLSKIGPVRRSRKKVQTELVALAQNNAAEMDGDSIVAQTEAVDGEQTFDVFRCR